MSVQYSIITELVYDCFTTILMTRLEPPGEEGGGGGAADPVDRGLPETCTYLIVYVLHDCINSTVNNL